MGYKVIIAHPGKQHSFQLAKALKKENMLFKYITTVYDKKGSITSIIKNKLKGDLKKKANTRRIEDLNDNDVIQYNEFWGLFLIFCSKVSILSKFCTWLNYKISDSFGKKVARFAIKNQVDAVICYDSNCKVLFEILSKKAPNILRIMDVSIANRAYTKLFFDEDIKLTKCNNIKKEQNYYWNINKMKRYKSEIELTQKFLVPSNYVKNSLLYENVEPNNIEIVPYGVDTNKFNYLPKNKYNLPLNLLYVGNVIYRKGVHHLLKVVSEFPEGLVNLTVVGVYKENSPIYTTYKNYNNIKFKGFVTRDAIEKIYQNSDIFTFPSLSEGFALVTLEAMGCGLPLIVSKNSGANDAITNYENGIVINVSDEKELKSAIDWFINNINKINDMSKKSRETALKYTWDNYYNLSISTIKKWLNERVKYE